MKFTDIFIKRPVLASVLSLLILFFGISALFKLQIRQFPRIDSTIITVTTSYPGADANLISGFVTTPLEAAIGSAEGIDYISSKTVSGYSYIEVNIKLNYSPEKAFTEVMSKVQEIRDKLPPDAQQPIIIKKSDSATALLYISLDSKKLNPQQITDYAERVVQPKLQTIEGVAKAEVLGGKTYSMRIFLDPLKMAAFGITAEDVNKVLYRNNYLTAAGNSNGEYVTLNIHANTNLTTKSEFGNLIIKSSSRSNVHLKDISKIELGSENYESSVRFDGKKAIFLAITNTPESNPLTVIENVRKYLPDIQAQFPPSLISTIVYDATDYIRASIKEVLATIFEAAIIVVLVIYLFLGSLRTVLIPIVTIPLSLIGVCALILLLGYSINLLTLLAFVLAIGLVVDDAIVVVENIHRHIENGMNTKEAAFVGAREICVPIITMTLTLAAVYAPIGFMQGLTGALFKEFAFTLASSVIISGIIALTLTPMMCANILSAKDHKGAIGKKIDILLDMLDLKYQNTLHEVLNMRKTILIFSLVILAMLPYLYTTTAKETAPEEDVGFFFILSKKPEYANLNYIEAYTKELDNIYKSLPETEHFFTVNTQNPNSGIALKPWDERKRSQFKLKKPLQDAIDKVSGLKSYAIIPPSLPGSGGGTPIEFIIKTTSDFKSLYEITEKLMEQAKKSGMFMYLDNNLKINHPEINIEINREKAAQLGIDMQSIGSSLNAALSESHVNFFDMQGRSYKVIPQLERKYRMSHKQLLNIYLKANNETMVPLSTIIKFSKSVQPNAQTHFQQLNSATIQGIMLPGFTLGEGLEFLDKNSKKLLPKGFTYDYAGESRQYIKEGSSLIFAFFMAIIVIYLILAAQYESFRDPLIILTCVPMSICGALIPLNLGISTINIYTQIGLITLIGLITKHGILLVDFANKLQKNENLSRREAVEKAAITRLRPILMTTAAMVFGVLPLLVASGAGAVSRFAIGLVIASGLLIGTWFTLFIVPTIYTYLAKENL